jgi:hypothetical protein
VDDARNVAGIPEQGSVQRAASLDLEGAEARADVTTAAKCRRSSRDQIAAWSLPTRPTKKLDDTELESLWSDLAAEPAMLSSRRHRTARSGAFRPAAATPEARDGAEAVELARRLRIPEALGRAD